MKSFKKIIAASGITLAMAAASATSFASSTQVDLDSVYSDLGLTSDQQTVASEAINDYAQNQKNWGSLVDMMRKDDQHSTAAKIKGMTNSYLNAQENALEAKLEGVMSQQQAEEVLAYVDSNMPAPDYFDYLSN